MNIAIICNYTLKPNRIGGMDRFYKLFNEKMEQKGNEIDWYFSDYQKFVFYKELNITSAEGKSVEEEFISVSKQINKKYDIIITHFTQLCTKYYKKFKEFHSNSYIIAVDHNPRPLEGFSLKKRLKKRLEGLLYSKYINQFIGVSKYTTYHILKDYGYFLEKKTKVVYNGIDTSVFKKRTENNNYKFIIASHLRESKGIQDLLKALNFLDEELLKKIQVDIYGEGPFQSRLKQISKNFNLEKNVDFKGSSSNLNNLFSEYSYMIQPTYMECFSLSILESLSANVPVITTTVGGNLEVLKDGVNGYIFNPKDYQKLTFILTNILSDKEKIKIDVSKVVEEKFDIKRMVEEHLKLIPCI